MPNEIDIKRSWKSTKCSKHSIFATKLEWNFNMLKLKIIRTSLANKMLRPTP
jgi:hypothetical protein